VRRAGSIVSIFALVVLVLVITIWASLALWYRLPAPQSVKVGAASLFAVIGLSTIAALFGRRRLPMLGFFIAAFGGLLIWWNSIAPARSGNWAPDVARQVTGTRDGDMLTLTNVRDFEWRSDDDFTERWATRSYDLSKLKSLDLFMSYWAGPEIAHTILSFGFEGGDYLALSIEVRRVKGGEFSPLADLFKTNPLVIIAADERDVVRVRSNIRHEDVQIYRLNAPPEKVRPLLLEYVDDANALSNAPKFYNSISTNCTTTIVKMMRAVGDSMPFNWRFIVNGYLPDYAYARGALDTRVPLSKLKAKAHIDQRATEAGYSPEFSRLIRVGVPFSQEHPTQ
jgi:Domain of unknown function (DUF4105)